VKQPPIKCGACGRALRRHEDCDCLTRAREAQKASHFAQVTVAASQLSVITGRPLEQTLAIASQSMRGEPS
jgi:hypothetical protein